MMAHCYPELESQRRLVADTIARIRAVTTEGPLDDKEFADVDPVEDLRILLAEYDRLIGVAQGSVSCGVTDQDKIETLQKLVTEYHAGAIAGAKADVAAHGLPGARVQGELSYCDFPDCKCDRDLIAVDNCPANLSDPPPDMPQEQAPPLKQRDMTIVGGLFALRFLSDGQMAELYIEDDEFYHLKASFNRSWLNDLQIVAEAGDDCKDGPSISSTKSGGAA